VRFGPDGCAYIADYGAVRDFGRSDPDAGFKNAADAALVQIPGTGVIWKICPNWAAWCDDLRAVSASCRYRAGGGR
jgi:hypothetical protein